MTIDPDDLVKMLAQQSYQIKLMALQIADQATLIEPRVPKCMSCHKNPYTVKHVKMSMTFCDRCAAETIIKSSRAFVNLCQMDPDDPFVEVCSSLMDENAWRDVDDAEKIRRMTEFVNIIKEIDVTQDRTH